MQAPKVLIIEDDARLGAAMVKGFRERGYETEIVNRADTALAVDPAAFDVIVLDVNLPGGDGLALLDRFRSRTNACILMVTARTELQARLQAFERGAADFIPKPFYMEELFARIEARRGRVGQPPVRETLSAAGAVELDRSERTLYRGGEPVPVTALEMNVLLYLVERPGRAVTRAQLAEATLSDDNVDPRTVDSHVARLRRKLGPAGIRLRTVWGLGYRFE